MDLNIRQIRAFVTVASLGSFTRAAMRLHLSQPALTVQIRNLEEMLGSRLLDRNSRGVEPTRIGQELLPMLQKTLLDMETLLHDARELGGTRVAKVRVAALPSLAASLLPDLILESRRAQPTLGFIVKDAVASTVSMLVRSGEVDMGLTGGEQTESDFEVMQLAHDRLFLVLPQDHPLAAKKRIGVQQILELPLVLMAHGTSVRALVDAAFARLGRAPVLTCEPTYMMTAVAMVRAGLGLTILPGSVREIAAEPGLRALPIDDARFVRSIALIKKRGRSLPPASEIFMTLCCKALKRL